MDDSSPHAAAEPTVASGEEEPTPAPRRGLRWIWSNRLRLAFVGILLLVILCVCLEVAARRYFAGTWGFLREDAELGWANRSNYTAYTTIPSGHYWFTKNKVSLNSKGFNDRDRTYEKPEGTYRILVIGDSFVEAMQIPVEDNFMSRLERRLNDNGGDTRYEVINFGCGNYGTDQQYVSYTLEGRKYQPDIVLLVVFPANDFSDNSMELNTRAYFPKPFFRLRAGTPERVEPNMKPAIAFEVQHINPLVRRLLNLSSYLIARSIVVAYCPRLSDFAETLKLIPKTHKKTPEGRPLFQEIFRTPLDRPWLEALTLTEALLGKFRDAVEADGSTLVGVVMPVVELSDVTGSGERMLLRELPEEGYDRGQPARLAAEALKRQGIACLDLTGAMLKAVGETQREVHLTYDGHLNEFGHEVTSNALYEFLQKHDLGGKSTIAP